MSAAPTSEAALFTAERTRQIEVEGWSKTHDDAHDSGELLRAGMCYFAEATGLGSYRSDGKPLSWPWADVWWKPGAPDRNFVKAGALFLAERERLKRAGRYFGHVDQKLLVAEKRFAEYRASLIGEAK